MKFEHLLNKKDTKYIAAVERCWIVACDVKITIYVSTEFQSG